MSQKGKGCGKDKGQASVEGNQSQGIKNANDWSCFDCGSVYHWRGNPLCPNRVVKGAKKQQARIAIYLEQPEEQQVWVPPYDSSMSEGEEDDEIPAVEVADQ